MHHIYKSLLGKGVFFIGLTFISNLLTAQTVSISAPSPICSGSNAQYSINVTGGNAPYVVTYNDGTTQSNRVTDGSGFLLIDTVITSNTTITVESVTNDNGNGATVASGEQATVLVRALPTATLSPANHNVCYGTTINSSITVTGSGNIFFEIQDLNFNTIYADIRPAGTYNFSSLPLSSTTYYVAALVDDFCAGTSSSVIAVDVKEQITASVIAPSDVCIDNDDVEVTYVVNAISDLYNIFYNVNGTPFSKFNQSGNLVETYPDINTTTTFTIDSIQYSSDPKCTTPINASATTFVSQLPTADLVETTDTLCEGSLKQLVFNVTGDGTIFVRYKSSYGLVGTLSGPAGTLTETLFPPVGDSKFFIDSVWSERGPATCYGTVVSDTSRLFVKQAPNIFITPNKTDVCEDEVVILTATVTGSSAAAAQGPFTLSYTVNGGPVQTQTFPLGVTSFNMSFNVNTTINLISISDASNPVCTTPLTQSITFTVKPKATVVFTGDTTICQDKSATVYLDFTGVSPFAFQIDGVSYTAGNDTSITVAPVRDSVFDVFQYTDALGCIYDPGEQVTITVYEKPDITFLAPIAVCRGSDAEFVITLTGGTPNFSVFFSGVSPVFNPTNVPNGTFTYTRPIFDNTTIVLDSILDSSVPEACHFIINDSRFITAVIPPTASIGVADATVCQGDAVNLQFSQTGSGVLTIYWSGSDGSSGTVLTPAGSTSQQVVVNTAGPVTFRIDSVVDGSPASCTTYPNSSVVVNVDSRPLATISGNGTYCEGTLVDLTISLSGEGDITVNYEDNFGKLYTYSNVAGTYLVPIDVSPSTGTITFNVLSVSSNSGNSSCVGLGSSTAIISVVEAPTASVTSPNTHIVIGGTATLYFNVTGVGPFDIVYSDGTNTYQLNDVSLAGTEVDVNPVVTTTYTVLSVVDKGTTPYLCTALTQSDITIRVSNAQAAINGNATICLGETFDAVVSFASSGEWNITVGDGQGNNQTFNGVEDQDTITITPVALGARTYTILSATHVPTSTVTTNTTGEAVVNVVEQKTVTISGISTVCEGTAASIFFDLEGSGTFTVHYTDEVNNYSFSATAANSPVTQTIAAGNLEIGTNSFRITSVTNSIPSSVCPIEFSGTGTINVLPTPVVSFSLDKDPACFNDNVKLNFNFPGPGPFDVIYTTEVANTTTVDTAEGVSSGYSISFTATSDIRFTATRVQYSNPPTCVNNTNESVVLTVNSLPSGMISGSQTVCEGSSGNLRFLLTGRAPFSVTYTDQTSSYNFVTSTNDTSIAVSPTANTTYTIIAITDGNGCNGPGTGAATVEVSPLPTVTFSLDDDTVCAGDNRILKFNVQGTPPFEITYFENNVRRTFTAGTVGDNLLAVTPLVNTTYRLESVKGGSDAECIRFVNQSVSVVVLQKPNAVLTTTTPEICVGKYARIRAELTGVGTITVRITNTDQSFDTTFSGTAGPYFFFVLPQPGNNTYTAVTVSDQSLFNCVKTNASSVSINAVSGPTGTISTSSEVCEGGTITLEFQVFGQGLMDVTFANDRGQTGSFQMTAGTRTINVNPGSETGVIKYFITSIVETATGISCPGASTDTALAIVHPTPIATIFSENKTICQGQCTDLLISVEGNGPFTVDLTDGVVPFTLVLTNDHDGDGRLDETFTVCPAQTTTFRITQIRDNSDPACVNNSILAYTVRVNQNPTASISGSKTICEGDSAVLTFNLNGRAPLTLVYRESLEGGQVNDYTVSGLPQGIYTVKVSPNRSALYTVVSVSDNNAPQCITAPGSGSASIVVNPRPAGTLTLNPDEICAGQTSSLIFNISSGTAPYTLIYTAGGIPDTVVSAGNTLVIPVAPADSTIYRLLSIKESSNTACFRAFTDVVDTLFVNELPTATVDADPANICVGGNTVLRFKAKGFAPIVINYTQNGTPQPSITLTADSDNDGFLDATRNVIPGVFATGDTTIYKITSITDGNPRRTCNGNVFDTAAVVVNPVASASLVSATPSTICFGDSTQLAFNVTGNGTITIVFRALVNGVEVERRTVFGTAAQSPLIYQAAPYDNTTYEILSVSSNNGGVECPGTFSPGTISVTVNPRPTVSFTASPNPICSGGTTNLTFNFTGIGPFDVEYVIGGDTNIFRDQTSGHTIPVTLTDTTVIYVNYVLDGSAVTCRNEDSVGVRVDVNPRATARIFGDSTFCVAEQEGFYLELKGIGNIRVQYRDNLGNLYPAIIRTAGIHFIPITQAPGTRFYTLVSIDDQSIPRCLGSLSGSARVVVNAAPIAKFSGISDICEGESSTITVELIGGNPTDSITVYFKDNHNSTYTYSNRPGIYDVFLTPGDSSIYTGDSVSYNKLYCLGVVSGEGRIDVRPTPTGRIITDTNICRGQVAEISFELGPDGVTGPFDIVYQVGDDTPISVDRVMSGYTINVNRTTTTKIRLLEVIYSDIPLCTALNLDSITINLNDSLAVSVTPKDCNDSLTGFTLTLTIAGGIPSTYMVNDVPVTSPHTTEMINNGPYTFVVSDSSGCPAVVIQGNDTCDCISFSGTMASLARIDACENEVVFATHNGNHVKDANDTLIFVFTDRNDGTLGFIYGTNGTPGFVFSSGLQYEVEYYIVPVVADARSSTGFDATDRCLSVGTGTPVVFHKNSILDVQIVGNDQGAVCENDSITIRLVFSGGVGPYQVSFTPGFGAGVTGDLVMGSEKTYRFGLVPAGPGAIKVTQFVDLGISTGCELITEADSTYDYIGRPAPNAAFAADDQLVCEDQVVTFTPAVIDPSAQYNWSFGDILLGTGAPVTHAYTSEGNYNVRLTVTDTFGCTTVSAPLLIQVQAIPNATFTISPGPYCYGNSVDKEVTFTDVTNFIPGGNVIWLIDGQPVDVGGPGDMLTWRFRNKGEYVIEMVFTSPFGCSDTMRTTIDVLGPKADIVVSSVLPCVDSEYTFSLINMEDVQSQNWQFTGANGFVENGTGNPLVIEFPEGSPLGEQITVRLIMRDANGCQVDSTFSVELYETIANFSVDDTIHCNGTPFNVFDQSQPTTGFNRVSDWRWDFGGGLPPHVGQNPPPQEYDEAGTYNVKLTATGNKGCVDDTVIAVTATPLPKLKATSDTICSGQSTTLTVENEENILTTYNWTGPFIVGPTNQDAIVVTINSTNEVIATYTIDAVDINGCVMDTSITVSFFPLVNPFVLEFNGVKVFRDIDTSYAIGNTLDVEEVRDYDREDNRLVYAWSPDIDISCTSCPSPIISTLISREYEFYVTDIYGCWDTTLTQRINIEEKESIDVPDAFTPNNDGVNDRIWPDGFALLEVVEFKVFNRWGVMVHNGKGKKADAAWDGYFNGKLQAPDTYTYTVLVKTYTNKELMKKGTFSLIR